MSHALRAPRRKLLGRGQAGCVSISGARARMIVLTPSSFAGFSDANLCLLR
jgi:hypothetical protein